MTTLPDYSTLFAVTRVVPLRFLVRDGSNFVHDIQFLSGYLHDGRTTKGDVQLRRGRLDIKVMRDCWELGYKEHADSLELYTTISKLTISPVSSIRWEAADLQLFDRNLSIEAIYVGPDHWERRDRSELVISAPSGGWRLCIRLADHFAKIQLVDLRKPSLKKQ